MKNGIIVSFNSGFVTVVDESDGKEILCSLRGRFKITGTKPLVGDRVEYIVEGDRGRVESILPRHNVLERPKVSNVDQAVAVFSISTPMVPLSIVDRTVANISKTLAEILIVLNKIDITDRSKVEEFKKIYEVYKVFLVSAHLGTGIEDLRKNLEKKISVFAGPSGVGKSSIINSLLSANLKTGNISKTNFGKHTTTAVSLLKIEGGGFVLDTPGFTTVEFDDLKPEEVQKLFPEIFNASHKCLFDDCVHDLEPGCHVKEMVENGTIPKSRYENYLSILREVREKEGKFEKKR
ncbi:ribosome small subunit-dependent GTPase A [Athalassotoga saccharophila]|uniref:ribosome small subunit-dependent GTPase A n=1 Tax=Athalassotoga saccharophila TaxID=1441386 RepID=UPI00137A5AEC|nr:ribosome small subunit-dependent GTPase A [Athalassotoga saccharophila]BBJ28867.1 small ribosomal subunit biogenesis GTPase RsgA [Athalassotoga saccharophila]